VNDFVEFLDQGHEFAHNENANFGYGVI
jgi:hypothetical protein